MYVCPLEHVAEMFLLDVNRATDETGMGAERDGYGIERKIDRTRGCRLCHLAHFRGRRVLTLGEPVDLVVEQQDLHVDIAAQAMDQRISSDRGTIALTCHSPYCP